MIEPRLWLTNHAIARIWQRLKCVPMTHRAVKLPRSAWRRFSSIRRIHQYQDIYVTSSAMMVVSGKKVVTVVPLAVEALADVLIFKMCGTWP